MINPEDLQDQLDKLEDIEKATQRMVTQALVDFAEEAKEIFDSEQDKPADIGEDITREALDRLGTSVIDARLFGKVDYKQARYVFHPAFAVRQALFVDSKAEKDDDSSITIQTAQTSLLIQQSRAGQPYSIQGEIPYVYKRGEFHYLTTTVFVKYFYKVRGESGSLSNELNYILIVCLPNGFLQSRYNPSVVDGIWRAGRNAPSRGEPFRTRVSLAKLRAKQRWRVQKILLEPMTVFHWTE